ncbi:MAG: NAD(P)/FAD-dependent oxidoreductase [Candidatus Hodarchaeales archaeon]
MTNNYDVIIIGAGSVGVPTALALADKGFKTLVIEKNTSVGQSDNKHAIGGIRATHSLKGKIWTCQRSIEIFSTWQEKYGDDIEWIQGGYTFVAYTPDDEKLLRDTVKLQKNYGLNIDYVSPDKIKKLVPGINEENLLGGTYSPEDGNASPLLSIHAFYRRVKELGAVFHFKENVQKILVENGKIKGVLTDKETYHSQFVINAAGGEAAEIGRSIGLDLPVQPDSHEAGITEPVKYFFSPMVVDIRPANDPKFGNSKNYYFYQNKEGQIIFCLTPNPPIVGMDRRETSSFLPQVSKRMVTLLPRLKNIKIRRTWRGLYPMTPDGSPIVGQVKDIEGLVLAIGMCGQGFMLGPGLGEVIARLISKTLTSKDNEILSDFSLYRDFGKEEKLK